MGLTAARKRVKKNPASETHLFHGRVGSDDAPQRQPNRGEMPSETVWPMQQNATKCNKSRGVDKSTLSWFSGREVGFVPGACVQLRLGAVSWGLVDLSFEDFKRGH